MQVLESYIVRIYQRDRAAPADVAGIVEHVDGKRLPFSCASELIALLRLVTKQRAAKAPRRRRERQ